MGVRRESVRLDLEGNFVAEAAKVAAVTALLDQHLDHLGGTSVRSTRGVSGLTDPSSGIPAAGTAARRAGPDIDRLSGRVKILGQALAILGPSAAPIAAVAIPAVIGLASQLGILALGAGASVVSFQGVGDALKALNDYGLDPTQENLSKVNQELAQISPEAQAFVFQLRDMLPALREVRDAGAAEFFPGLSDFLDSAETRLPALERLMGALGGGSGAVARLAGESLADGELDDILAFLTSEAPDALVMIGRTAGVAAKGLAELMIAFDPLNDEVASFLLGGAQNFEEWAAGLDETEGFQDFVDYVLTNGPEVAETFVSVANAALQIVEAAAPLGGPALDTLEAVAEVTAAIADSDMGPTILGMTAALSVLSRTQALTKSATSGNNFISKGFVLPIQQMRRELPTLSQAGTYMYRLGQSSEHVNKKTYLARQSVNQFGRTAIPVLGRVAAGGAAVALMSTGLGDKLGVANTASLALTGAMVGGAAGAVAGGLVGAFLDFNAVGGDADEILAQLEHNLSAAGGSLTAYQAAVEQASAATDDFFEKNSSDNLLGFLGESLTPGGLALNLDVLFGGVESSKLGELSAAENAARENAGDLELALDTLARSYLNLGAGSQATLSQMETAFTHLTPAMTALDISVEDLMAGVKDGSILDLVDQLTTWQRQSDSTEARTRFLAKAVGALENDLIPTVDAAEALSDALDAYFGPALNAEEATHAWRESLAQLRTELDSDFGFSGLTEKGRANAELTRANVESATERLVALAGLSSTTEEQLAVAVKQTRQEFIASGIAAGYSRKEIEARANALRLTPKLLKLVLQEAGVTETDLKIRALRKALDGVPRKVRSDIRANGVPETMAEVDALVKKYELTEKQREALITLKDEASGRAALLNRILDNAARDRQSTITVVSRNVRAPGDTAGGPAPEGNPVPRKNHGGPSPRVLHAIRSTEKGSSIASTAALHEAINRGGSSAGRASTGMAISLNDVHLTGTLDTPWGPAEVEGIARGTARQELDAEFRFAQVRSAR